MHVCHIFFIHSSVNGHLGYFLVLAIVNSTAINIEVDASFQLRVFIVSGYMPRSGLLYYMIALFLDFWKISILKIFHTGCNNLHSHQSYRRVFFSIPSPAFIIYKLFNDSYSDWCEVTPYCSLNRYFEDRMDRNGVG